MPTLSGAQAIAWMRARMPLGSKANVPGSCLNTCWQAYGSHGSIGPHAGQYPNAIDGWNYATRRHPGDTNPPAGVPVYYGVSPTRTDSNARAGDVVISLGGGQIIGTDVGGAGRIGITTVTARAAAISRPYLGWTEDFLGYDVISTAAAGSAATPISTTKRSKDMYLEWDTGGTGWLVTDVAWVGLTSMAIYNTFKRVITSDQTKGQPDIFNRAEVDMMNAVQRGAYLGVLGGPVTLPTFDTTKLADAVSTALSAKGIVAKVSAADPELTKALDAGFVRATTAYANAAATAVASKVDFDPVKLANAVAQSLQKSGVVTTVDTKAVQDAVSAAISRATAAIAKATAPVT